MRKNTYIFKTGKVGNDGLKRQHALLKKHSHYQLELAGIKPGMQVYDLGCGTGIMTDYIAKKVGRDGHVFAIDSSSEQLEVAKSKIVEAKLNNVSFIRADLEEFDFIGLQQADIVYIRLLLMYLQKPKKLLEKILNLLKPGGVLCLHESTIDTTYASFKNNFISECFDAAIRLGKAKGFNFNIGRMLVSMCEDIGFKSVNSFKIQEKLSIKQAKEFKFLRLDEWGEEAKSFGIVSAEQLNSWQNTFDNLPEDNPHMWLYISEQTYAVVTKLFFS